MWTCFFLHFSTINVGLKESNSCLSNERTYVVSKWVDVRTGSDSNSVQHWSYFILKFDWINSRRRGTSEEEEAAEDKKKKCVERKINKWDNGLSSRHGSKHRSPPFSRGCFLPPVSSEWADKEEKALPQLFYECIIIRERHVGWITKLESENRF